MLAADDPAKKLRALVFSKTAGFRHDSIPSRHRRRPEARARRRTGRSTRTEDASLFTAAVLSHYDVVIFLSTTGDILNAAQQTAFENFIRCGKGYVGIHAAADGEYDWRWYGNLVGAYFRNHPAGTPPATVVTEDITDPSTAGPSGPLDADGRVVQLQGAEQRERRRLLAPQHARRARPAEDGRVDVRGGRRHRRRRRRPPDLVVPALRRRTLVLHRPRPHAGVVPGGRDPVPHRGRDRDRRGRAPVGGLRRRAAGGRASTGR